MREHLALHFQEGMTAMDEATRRRPSTPKGLGLTGRRLWKSIVSAYRLRPDELFVLESACRTADTIELLESSMAGQPLQVKGSMGQMREHPLLSEARQQRALLARLLGQMKLPDELTSATDPRAAARWAEGGVLDRSAQARSAAMARWHRGGE